MKYLKLIEIDIKDDPNLTADKQNEQNQNILLNLNRQLNSLHFAGDTVITLHPMFETIECDSEICRLNPQGTCLAPLLTRKHLPRRDDNGCKDFALNEDTL